MTYPRMSQVSLDATPYYHCVARCVRRSWLWGYDAYSGKDFSHRKGWVLERLRELSGVFAIDIAAFAVLSNHYHLVVHVDRQRAERWTAEEVVQRWSVLFGVPSLVRRVLAGDVTAAERDAAAKIIATWRRRLYEVSWYMRCLNEHLARRANEEDQCKGRFWEGRFKSQALLDEAGLLTAMAYVDLNPVRARIAATPEESEFTSIYERIRQLKAESAGETEISVPLQPFQDAIPSPSSGIPFGLLEYLELVDWSGRNIVKGQRGTVDVRAPAMLERLNIDPAFWTTVLQPSGNRFGRAIGRIQRLHEHAQRVGQRWFRGLRPARQLFGPT